MTRPTGPAYLHPDGRLAVARGGGVDVYHAQLSPNRDDLQMTEKHTQAAEIAQERGDRQTLAPEPCNPGLLHFCATMSDALARDANARRGLTLVVTTRASTGETRVRGVAYRKHTRHRGTFLDFCPWCGAQILAGAWGTEVERQ